MPRLAPSRLPPSSKGAAAVCLHRDLDVRLIDFGSCFGSVHCHPIPPYHPLFAVLHPRFTVFVQLCLMAPSIPPPPGRPGLLLPSTDPCARCDASILAPTPRMRIKIDQLHHPIFGQLLHCGPHCNLGATFGSLLLRSSLNSLATADLLSRSSRFPADFERTRARSFDVPSSVWTIRSMPTDPIDLSLAPTRCLRVDSEPIDGPCVPAGSFRRGAGRIERWVDRFHP
jgi:hypothetical protein